MWTKFWGGMRGLFRKERAEREMDEELRDFLEKSTAGKMGEGGAASWETHIENIWSDLRFGARLLRFNPVFAAAAILSLALGIGANTAIFQLLDAVRLRSLPVKNAQEIGRVKFDRRGSRSGNFSTRYPDFTFAIWEQIRDNQQGFSSVYAW